MSERALEVMMALAMEYAMALWLAIKLVPWRELLLEGVLVKGMDAWKDPP